MAHGDGSVYQRPDGKWVAQLWIGWTAKGTRRKRTRLCATEKLAKTALRDMRREWLTAQTALDPRLTVKRYADGWIEGYAERNRPQTVVAARASLRWIIEAIGHRQLRELTAGDMAKVSSAVTVAGRSASTASNARRVLHTMLADARAEGHTIPEPAMVARMPVRAANPRGAFPVPDAARILQVAGADRATWPELLRPDGATDSQWKALREGRRAAEETDVSRWAAAFLQGLRQGECLGLTWSCVDLDRGEIDVSWQLQEISPKATPPADYEVRRLKITPKPTARNPEPVERDTSYCLVRPKTRAGQRVMPLVPWMVEALKVWRERCPESPHDLVWPTPSGTPRKPQIDTKAFQELVRLAAVPPKANGSAWVLHEARHTTVSILLALRVPTQVIIAIVGHSSFASTQTYAHVDLAPAREALEGVASELGLLAMER